MRRIFLQAAVAVLVLGGCGGGESTGPPPTQQPPPQQPPGGGGTTVTIGDNSFTPQSITVASGATVRWVNGGQQPHNSTGANGSWSSPTLQPGQSFERAFPSAGSFQYTCTLHAGMTGTVVVQ